MTKNPMLKVLLLKLRDDIVFSTRNGVMRRPGLCDYISAMRDDKIITHNELQILTSYVIHHRPKWYQKDYDRHMRGFGYYWPVWNSAPRVKWLNHQIDKL